ncbi:MAG: ATP-binding protein [Gammaproteobacteria bacterium]|nr:ATP-binding protein [Gammaproteobacteria bacterium]
MIDPYTIGEETGQIDVELSYRIIELFSGGLYSSPNKTFEELVTNSYDADASQVGVGIPTDIVNDDFLWVLDNGFGMDSAGLSNLWKIGESTKRTNQNKAKRMQIGRFGIGKLATFILANRLTHISKKNGEYRTVTMDFSKLNTKSNKTEMVQLKERTLTVEEAKLLVEQYVKNKSVNTAPFKLFGQASAKSWTFSLMSMLKPRAHEIKVGRLRWVLSTALPLNPQFRLYLNGTKIESSKVAAAVEKRWIIGKNDKVAEQNSNYEVWGKDGKTGVSLPNLPKVHGEIALYKESLATGKSENLSRSHGIFLMVRNRLINLDEPLLPGMGPFAHGAFNKTRMVVHADELDDLITSTRESIKEAPAYTDLKQYLTRKFSELHKYWLEKNTKEERSHDVSYKLSRASYSLTRAPLFHSAQQLIEGRVGNSVLITVPELDDQAKVNNFISALKKDLESEEGIIHSYEDEYISPSLPVCKLELLSRTVYLNMLHPFVIFNLDSANDISNIRLLVTAEILNEAQMIEAGIDDEKRRSLIHKRDQTLREIASSDKNNPATVAQMIADSQQDADKLEEAVVAAFTCLGFDAVPVGGKGKPDGVAHAHLGSSDGIDSPYTVTLDAKSTKHAKASSGNISISNIDNHRRANGAQHAVIVAPNYEGKDNETSKINIEANKFSDHITLLTTSDLITLVTISGPKQISLAKLKELFETCATPNESATWIATVEALKVTQAPYIEILETAYEMQKEDIERPTISSIRYSNSSLKKYAEKDIRNWVEILERQLPSFISLDGGVISLNTSPDKIKKELQRINSDLPLEYRAMHKDAFGTNE